MRRLRPADPADIEISGPWVHRYVAANGARFHVCEAIQADALRTSGRTPLVVLLHGFPEFWWAWRHQLPALAAAGYRAVALDLRGYGTSDKTPRGYDALTLAADVTGVIHALGASTAIVVGHGWGGYVGWTVAARTPGCVAALCVVAAAHPREFTRWTRWRRPLRSQRHLLAMQLPWLPERRIARGRYVDQHLTSWAAPGSTFPTAAESARYRAALAQWPSSHCALEYHRWLVRSRLRSDGRAFDAVLRATLDMPVLHIGGAEDPAGSASAVDGSARHVRGELTVRTVRGAGHFPHEERPEEFNDVLLEWLARCTAGGTDGRS